MAFIDKTVEVGADIRAVYALWAAFEDYPRFMAVVDSVDVVQADRLHWVAILQEETVEWDADIVEHVPETRIRWEAVDGREAGEVTFDKVGSDRTSVHYQLDYDAAAWGKDEAEVRGLMAGRVDADLAAFKEVVEQLA
jgi:uncharacterized membrane protein